MLSGVANSAAWIRSPSFSRSSSSTTTRISPRAYAATASSIWAKGMSGILPGEQSLDVLGRDVDLEVHTVARALVPEGGDLRRVRDDRDGEVVVARLDDGEADAVDGDRALLHHVAEELAIRAHAQVGGSVDDLADRVDVPLDEVAAQAIAQADRALEVHAMAGLE